MCNVQCLLCALYVECAETAWNECDDVSVSITAQQYIRLIPTGSSTVCTTHTLRFADASQYIATWGVDGADIGLIILGDTFMKVCAVCSAHAVCCVI